ncbi:GTP cyclohydrolase I FolE [Limibacillus sp. MBR-115]|jgi:GTP cyclohydrolase I|uniref:GTP cyclohydrolase I FolE n=1 Tax=Limibacillus sp. MBR-115 TaxID=3156465 RepID=UPI003397F0D6
MNALPGSELDHKATLLDKPDFSKRERGAAGDVRRRPSRSEAEAAVETLLRWAGDDPYRPGLLETPGRVVRAYEEWFSGYRQDPVAFLNRTFGEVGDYNDAVTLSDIPFHSVCEHHMAAIRGVAHVSYLPVERVVGISKLARVVEACARRLQVQERLTDEIAHAIAKGLKPGGVAVVLVAEHACMTTRGVRAHGVRMVTRRLLGAYRDDAALRREFLGSIGM